MAFLKNVAGQKIGAQLVSATDGSNFTGSVTVYVTGDAGTQAAGSVGSGACTHEGKGYHTYAPAQAETNYDLIAFTFEGTAAVTATVQVLTDGDFSATQKTSIGTAVAASAVASVTAAVSITGDLSATMKTSVRTQADNALAAVGIAGVEDVAAAVFDRAFPATYGSYTFDELVKLIVAVLLGKASGLAGTTAVYRNLNDSATVISATVDADGNRTAVTRTP